MIKPAKLNFIDKLVRYISPELGLKRMATRTRIEAANQYRGAETSRLRADWIISSDTNTPDSWELSTLRERSRDLNRNDPVASGATDTMSLNVVGSGLRMQSRIRAEYLGLSDERARKLQRQAEMIWQIWCKTADAANRLDFDEIQFLALRKIIEDGETIAIPVMLKDEWRMLGRAIELIESERLATPPKKRTMKNNTGIETGDRGEPKTYHIRGVGEKSDKYTPIPALDKKGRPKILHVYKSLRPGQLRGIPFFAPVLTYFKDLSDYMEAEVVAARVAACLAVFITQDQAFDMAVGNATGTETTTNARIQSMEPGLVGYLNRGESVDVVDPKRPGDSFGPFVEGLLRMIGMALNLPYELLVKDFSKTNYSSARAALLEGRRSFMHWRGWLARKFNQPIYDLVMEEAYLRGLFDAPDFYEYRTEYTRAAWIGGGWGWVDPVKEVEASRKAIDYGLSNLARENAAQGEDWEENLEQLKKEKEKIRELDVDINNAAKGGNINGGEKDGVY